MLICDHCKKPIEDGRAIVATPFIEKVEPWIWTDQFTRGELDLEIALRTPEGRDHDGYHLHEQCLAELLVHFFTRNHYPSAQKMLDACVRLENV